MALGLTIRATRLRLYAVCLVLAGLMSPIFAYSVATARPEEVGFSSERLRRIHDTIQRHIDGGNITGAVTLVASRGRIAHFEAHGLMDLAPPGLDELVAILEVTSLMVGEGSRTWDQIVIDTAPTGHALRLLEMPALVQDWTHALMRIVLKYQPVVGAGNLGQLLLTLSKQIGALRDLLVDRSLTQFVLVTRAAALPRAETVRFLAALSSLGITVPAVVVNAVGRGGCGACRRAAVAERR